MNAVKGLRTPLCAYASLIGLFMDKEKLNYTHIVLSHSTQTHVHQDAVIRGGTLSLLYK
jgi:hypothetical protein